MNTSPPYGKVLTPPEVRWANCALPGSWKGFYANKPPVTDQKNQTLMIPGCNRCVLFRRRKNSRNPRDRCGCPDLQSKATAGYNLNLQDIYDQKDNSDFVRYRDDIEKEIRANPHFFCERFIDMFRLLTTEDLKFFKISNSYLHISVKVKPKQAPITNGTPEAEVTVDAQLQSLDEIQTTNRIVNAPIKSFIRGSDDSTRFTIAIDFTVNFPGNTGRKVYFGLQSWVSVTERSIEKILKAPPLWDMDVICTALGDKKKDLLEIVKLLVSLASTSDSKDLKSLSDHDLLEAENYLEAFLKTGPKIQRLLKHEIARRQGPTDR